MRGATRLRDAIQVPRVWKYRALSTCRNVTGSGIVHQPVLLLGSGAIRIGRDVRFGWPTSPQFHTGYIHLEASGPEALIELGDGAEINNNAYIKSEGAGIFIAERALLGSNVQILDSDFHDLHPDRRRGGQPAMARRASWTRTSSSATAPGSSRASRSAPTRWSAPAAS